MKDCNSLYCFKVTANNFYSTTKKMKFRQSEIVNAADLTMCDITEERNTKEVSQFWGRKKGINRK
jgi:hypothetical protein